MSRAWADIDCRQWLKNLSAFTERVSPAMVMPVVKSDAYGLGARQAVKIFIRGGIKRIAVATVEEARALADLPVEIQFLGVPETDEIGEIVSNNWVGSVGDRQTADVFSAEAIKRNRSVRIHILIDTGMGRLGFLPSQACEEISRIAALPGIEVEGIYSHFPAAEKNDEFAIGQVKTMELLFDKLQQNAIDIRHCHLANSYAIASLSVSFQPPFTMVRPGIELHGVSDKDGATLPDIQPVLTLKSRLLSVRKLPRGSTIGYGRTFRLPDDSLVGTIPIGYADGYPRSLSNVGEVLIRGRKCRVIGSVCMDYIQVALDNVPEVRKGEEVVLVGRQGKETIALDELAVRAGTITYDLLTGLGPRVERHYSDLK
ncbi:MAG: alanine racemase [Lentisphaeria bacterium]